MIVLTKLPAEQRHVRLSEDDEMIEAFLFDGLDKTLHERNCIRRSNGSPLSLDLAIREDIQEWLRILAIVVVHQEIARHTLRFRVPDKGLGLLDHPFPIRLIRRRRNVDATSVDVQKNEDKHIAKAGFRDNLLGEKVTLPHGRRVAFQKLIPRPGPRSGPVS